MRPCFVVAVLFAAAAAKAQDAPEPREAGERIDLRAVGSATKAATASRWN